MKCPRDGSNLGEERYEGDVFVDGCDLCGGIWLDDGELEKIEETSKRDYSKEVAELEHPLIRSKEPGEKKKASCPKCGVEMAPREYAYASQIEIDVCPEGHGVWLDGGELEEIEIFFERQRAAAKKEQPDEELAAEAMRWKIRGFFHGLKKMIVK